MVQKFETGKTYTARSVCDYDCVFSMDVMSRTEKTVTVKVMGETKRCKIKEIDGVEAVYALGRYSMAPLFRAA